MPVDVRTTIEIDRPRSVVADYVANPDNAMSWYRNISQVEWETTPPVEVGSKVAFVANFLGRTMKYTYEVELLIPEERFVMGTVQGPFPMETSYTWRDTPDGGTRMELRNRGKPTGLSRISAPVMKSAMRRANTKDLRRLKEILEGSAS